MPRPGEAVGGFGVARGAVRFGVGVGPHLHRIAAVAEVPRLVADFRAERSHLERHPVARPDAERGGVAGVNRRRDLPLLLLPPVVDLDHGKIVFDPAPGVANLEDFAVTAGPLVGAFYRGPFRRAAVLKGPLVAGHLTRRAP